MEHIQTNKLYLVIDANGVIQRGYIQFTEKPEKQKAFCTGFNNFDVNTDFANAVIVSGIDYNDIIWGQSTLVNGVFNKNENIA